MATYNKFNAFVKALVDGTHDMDGHTFKFYLTNATPNGTTHTVKANIAELDSGNGYPSGGKPTTVTTSNTNSLARVIANDVSFTATGPIPAFRYVILYNDTSASDSLVAYWDYGSSITLQTGETFTVDCNATTGIFTIA